MSGPGAAEPGPFGPEDAAGLAREQAARQAQLRKRFDATIQDFLKYIPSHLTRPVADLLVSAWRKRSDPAEAEKLVGMAVHLSQSMLENSIETPEVMVKGAILLFQAGRVEAAVDYLYQARDIYEKSREPHRHALTLWLLGMLEYFRGSGQDGYLAWKTGQKAMDDLLKKATVEDDAERMDWYKQKGQEIDQAIQTTFEAAYYDWLRVEQASLGEALQAMKKGFLNLLYQQKAEELRAGLQVYLRTAGGLANPDALRAALVDAAFYRHQLGDDLESLELLEKARVSFQHGHNGAVVQWLQGWIEKSIPSRRSEALLHWTESIRQFEELAAQADREDRQADRTWYEEKIGGMRSQLKELK